MIGWKRIVVTVGEKIGKEHLTYGQGAAAEIDRDGDHRRGRRPWPAGLDDPCPVVGRRRHDAGQRFGHPVVDVAQYRARLGSDPALRRSCFRARSIFIFRHIVLTERLDERRRGGRRRRLSEPRRPAARPPPSLARSAAWLLERRRVADRFRASEASPSMLAGAPHVHARRCSRQDRRQPDARRWRGCSRCSPSPRSRADPAYFPDCENAADWLVARIAELGFEASQARHRRAGRWCVGRAKAKTPRRAACAVLWPLRRAAARSAGPVEDAAVRAAPRRRADRPADRRRAAPPTTKAS